MIVQNFKELRVWQAAMDLAEAIYRVTNTFPGTEQFGLSQQMRRSAISVPSNISEGFVREHLKEYIHFLSIAQGSLAELETQLQLSHRVCFINDTDFENISIKIEMLAKQLRSQRKALSKKSTNQDVSLTHNPQPTTHDL